jgi:hypothetical protein
VELQDMSSPSVNAVDQQKLDEFLQLKYQNLMDELQVLLVADEASFLGSCRGSCPRYHGLLSTASHGHQ